MLPASGGNLCTAPRSVSLRNSNCSKRHQQAAKQEKTKVLGADGSLDFSIQNEWPGKDKQPTGSRPEGHIYTDDAALLAVGHGKPARLRFA